VNTNFRKTLVTLGLLAAGCAQAASNGNITSLTACTLKPKVGEPNSITVNGVLEPGKSCHSAGGTVSPYKDLGLISSFPTTLSTSFAFDAVGPHYIHAYVGTEDKVNVCTVTASSPVKVDLASALVRMKPDHTPPSRSGALRTQVSQVS
jgi:hypothetical protein